MSDPIPDAPDAESGATPFAQHLTELLDPHNAATVAVALAAAGWVDPRVEQMRARAETAEALLATMDHFADVAQRCEDAANASHQRRQAAEAELAEHQRLLAAGEASDGHHTHRELYEYRMLYNAHAARGWLASGVPVVKSRRHSDGQECFGGGWFVVVATLPTGQVSNHYRDQHWDLFDVPAVDLAPTYDGHTPQDGVQRLRQALTTPAA